MRLKCNYLSTLGEASRSAHCDKTDVRTDIENCPAQLVVEQLGETRFVLRAHAQKVRAWPRRAYKPICRSSYGDLAKVPRGIRYWMAKSPCRTSHWKQSRDRQTSNDPELVRHPLSVTDGRNRLT